MEIACGGHGESAGVEKNKFHCFFNIQELFTELLLIPIRTYIGYVILSRLWASVLLSLIDFKLLPSSFLDNNNLLYEKFFCYLPGFAYHNLHDDPAWALGNQIAKQVFVVLKMWLKVPLAFSRLCSNQSNTFTFLLCLLYCNLSFAWMDVILSNSLFISFSSSLLQKERKSPPFL